MASTESAVSSSCVSEPRKSIHKVSLRMPSQNQLQAAYSTAKTTSAKYPITLRSSLDRAESSPVQVSCSFDELNHLRSRVPLRLIFALFFAANRRHLRPRPTQSAGRH